MYKTLHTFDDLDDAPDAEVEDIEERVVDQASAARTIAELKIEISQLQSLEECANQVRQSGSDRKWDELSRLCRTTPRCLMPRGIGESS